VHAEFELCRFLCHQIGPAGELVITFLITQSMGHVGSGHPHIELLTELLVPPLR
jgi:hypothetical protein